MHKKVYNLSLGGYGQVQYYYLLKNKAFKLNPFLIIVGFYYSNDLSNVFNIVYTRNYWEHLRRPDFIT